MIKLDVRQPLGGMRRFNLSPSEALVTMRLQGDKAFNVCECGRRFFSKPRTSAELVGLKCYGCTIGVKP